MRSRARWRKGAILLQTLVMSVILSMISVMILKWIMARYIIVNRVNQSAVNVTGAQEYANRGTMTWTIPPPSADYTMTVTRNGVAATKQVSFNSPSTVPAGTAGKCVTTVTDDY